MKVLKIKNADFINWYFNSGYDDEQESVLLELGRSIAHRLMDGNVTITLQDILDELIDKTIMPLNIVEGFEVVDSNMEIQDGIQYGRISEDFEIELV